MAFNIQKHNILVQCKQWIKNVKRGTRHQMSSLQQDYTNSNGANNSDSSKKIRTLILALKHIEHTVLKVKITNIS